MGTINGNHIMHSFRDMECDFVILDHFLPFYLTNNLENQNFEKMKNMPEYIIILYMCIINNNHMMNDSWDMEHDRQNFLLFWTTFCSFNPLTTRKIKMLENKKTHEDIIILPKCTKTYDHMLHCSWDRARDGSNFYFQF